MERQGNDFLQICKQLTSAAKSSDPLMETRLTTLRKEMGIMQHHDAVTGTEKQHVADDYVRRLDAAFEGCNENAKVALNKLSTKEDGTSADFTFSNCLYLNISSCSISETSNNFIVTVYNPLGYPSYEYIRFPVPTTTYTVHDLEGNEIPLQFVKVADQITGLEYRESTSEYDLVFKAENIPGVGFKSYYVTKTTTTNNDYISTVTQSTANEVVGTDQFGLVVDAQGLVTSIKVNNVESALKQNFYYYEGAKGDNSNFDNRASGAYIFRPAVDTEIHELSEVATTEIVRGNLVDEIHQIFNEWISQVIRIYKDDNHIEFEWLVGPIPVDDNIPKEIVTRYTSGINTNGEFLTDSSGREMLKRSFNYREYPATVQEEVAGNYYPIISKLAVEDISNRMSVLIDRAQGGTSLNNGEIELMIHRRLLNDDAFGVGEALNEQAYGKGLVARGKHFLTFGTDEGHERVLQAKVLLSAWPFFSNAGDLTRENWQNEYTNTVSHFLTIPISYKSTTSSLIFSIPAFKKISQKIFIS